MRSTHNHAACYKPNRCIVAPRAPLCIHKPLLTPLSSAFFEAFGHEGSLALLAVLAVIRECARDVPIPIILDNKRGDIDTTAQAYASASYDIYGADAVTLSPYMGFDSIKPFIAEPFRHKAAFVLCKTSNASSNDFQTLKVNAVTGETLYERVAGCVCKWNESVSTTDLSLGLVVGATDLIALRAVRNIAKNEWILCPVSLKTMIAPRSLSSIRTCIIFEYVFTGRRGSRWRRTQRVPCCTEGRRLRSVSFCVEVSQTRNKITPYSS